MNALITFFNEKDATVFHLMVRKLYERDDGVADNHVDERSFLATLRTNVGVVTWEFWPCVRSAFEVVHQMSSVSVLLVTGSHVERGRIGGRDLFALAAVLLLAAAALRTRMLQRDHIVARRTVSLARFLLDAYALDAASLCRGMWALLALTPVLHSLTQSFTDDTIGVLVVLAAAVHLFFYDYAVRPAGSRNRPLHSTGASAISLNAALLLAVLLGSRFDARAHVFGFDVIAALLLVVLPQIRLRLAARAAPLASFALSALLPLLTTALIASVSRALAGMYAIAGLLVCFGAPLLIVKLQRLKNRIAGPWDIAQPRSGGAAWNAGAGGVASTEGEGGAAGGRDRDADRDGERVCFYFPHKTRSDRSGRGILEAELVGRRAFASVPLAEVHDVFYFVLLYLIFGCSSFFSFLLSIFLCSISAREGEECNAAVGLGISERKVPAHAAGDGADQSPTALDGAFAQAAPVRVARRGARFLFALLRSSCSECRAAQGARRS